MPSERDSWLAELASQGKNRPLVQQEDTNIAPWDQERCVICNSRTLLWLQPENAPICSEECLEAYLKDPSVYDPRELHGKGTPATVEPKPPKPKRRRRRKPGRWEPTDAEIEAMQARVAKELRGKK